MDAQTISEAEPLKNINKKIITGFFTLTFRRIILTAIRAVTINIILIQILSPSVIGVFNIANSILTFFSYFSDVGLAGALIQKEKLERNDLTTTFTIQQILALIISGTLIIFAPVLAGFYHMDDSGTWLIRALAFGFFLSSLKVLPAVLLERELNFGKLVIVEVLETISYCSLLLILSFNGFGINGYSFAVIIQSIIGVTAIYILAPWKIGIKFSRASAKSLLHFGVPFQLNSMLALLKDRLVPLVVARMVSATGMGYITWAQSIAFMPLDFMSSMNRITFPAFSRIQNDKEMLKETLERSIFFTTLLVFPLLFGILVIAPISIGHIIKPIWSPALPLIYFFALNAFWASISTLCTNFLYAIGKAGLTLKLMIMWTTLEWLLTPVLTYYYGYLGVGIATAIISFTSIIPLLIVRKIVKVDFIGNLWHQVAASFVMAVLVYLISLSLPKNIPTVIFLIIIGGLIYTGVIFLLIRQKVLYQIKSFYH